MLQLVYTSTAKGAAPVDLPRLFDQSRRNNRRDEITGLLFTNDGRFLQVLEGAKEAVEDTFLRIIADPRHHGLILLSRRIIPGREFGEWDMAHCDGFEEHGELVERISDLTKDTPDFIQRAFFDLIGRVPGAAAA